MGSREGKDDDLYRNGHETERMAGVFTKEMTSMTTADKGQRYPP